jgi:hypothetical protein
LSVLPVGFGSAAGGTPAGAVERSLRFSRPDTSYLSRTPASAGNRRTWTWSCWYKATPVAFSTLFSGFNGSSAPNNGAAYSRFNNVSGGSTYDKLDFGQYNTGADFEVYTVAALRDYSAWYHIVITLDTTQATNTNRVKIYVNNTLQTLSGTYPTQNQDCWINAATAQAIGRFEAGVGQQADGYMAEVYFIDGQALTPSSFGETDSATGVWKPKAYSGTYGTNGFYLKFADNSGTTSTTLGKDSSGNSNNWTPNNFSVTAGAGNDSLVDSPTAYGTDTGVGGEVRGNYATWNPLINGDSAANGNLDVTNGTARSTQVLLQFDTYWEITSTGGTTTAGTISGTGTTNTTTIASTKTYGFRLTAAGTLDYKNITDGGSFTNITTGLTGQQFIYASAAAATTGSLNTGQRPFAATAPSGFKALCTTNLPTPTIGATSTTQANDYFNAVLYTGNGSTQSITGVGLQPDLVWLKSRSNATDNELTDAVRGATKSLISNSTAAEATDTNGLTAFNSDGFSLGTDANYNGSTRTYVAWNWNAGGSTVTNTSGTISAQVRANTTSGFSIVTYTGNGTAGATVGHGLGVTPDMIIVKSRSVGTGDWVVWHSSLTSNNNNYLILNSTAAVNTANQPWNNTLPTSSVFSLRTWDSVNQNSSTYVAYCFDAVAGYSAFGSYTGNGSTDGPFVYTNHRPAFLLVKRTDTTSNWTILDFQREGYNIDNDPLFPNLSDAEGTTDLADILSNGFKLRSTDASVNASGGTYIYMSVASNPFKYSLGR